MFKIISQSLPPDWMEEVEDADFGEQPGIVNDQNYQDFLVDELEKDQAENYDPNAGIPQEYTPMPDAMGYKSISYQDPKRLVNAGMSNLEVIGFSYTTKDGINAGWRIVEPHYTFIPWTTNSGLVLVAYDQSPGIDTSRGRIRSFIIGNIHSNGVRYKGSSPMYNNGGGPRAEIMRGV